ncbi:hypothetical protein BVG19_g1675 [[Candida] boidinii]|nr:hypothetical protein BVG19_g1675 [[Candida] boidinii]OWB49978.1 transferase activity protein [[Candida] boidinii]OWB85247.1 transferase activity protein [[Candida] boidinii]
MLNNKINNVLTLGFTDGLKHNVSSSINSRDKNFNSIILKNNIFKIIRSVIGDLNFLKLIFHNTAIFKKDIRFVLFGPIPKRKPIVKKNGLGNFKEIPKKCLNLISLNRMLYANKSMAQYNDPIGESYDVSIRQVFMDKNERWFKNLPKKFPLIFKLFSKIFKNHESLKYSYSYIFDSVCCDNDQNNNDTQFQTDIIKSQTSKKKIIKFIIIIISKIFPIEIFGDSKNFQIIISRISQYINRSKINNFMKISDIIKNIKLNNIPWIRSPSNRNQNKFEFERSKVFFTRFVHFLFNKFINSLICLFFHVTEISQTHNLIYFKHSIWSKLTKNFENKFFNNNLKLVTDSSRCYNKLYNFTHNTHLIGKMKILPKLNNDFRIIVKPNRFNSNLNDIDYNNMVNFEIKPTLKILKCQNNASIQKKNDLNCQGKKIYNVNDLPSIIHGYKEKLLKKYQMSNLPQIYVLKFDVKNCYDSIPVNEILNKIDNLFPDENQMFYTRYINIIDSNKIDGNNNNSLKKKLILLNKPNINSFDQNSENNINPSVKTSLIYDNAKTLTFNKEKIRKIIEYQLFNSAIYKNNKTYIRKDGLFQGYPLSGALCDILYDSIELKFLKILNESDNNEELLGKNNNCLIRIADDFLILSDNYHSVNKLKRLISRRIDKFNFTVNRLKTINNFSDKDGVCAMSSVNFCGYTIDLNDLSIIKSFESFNSYPFKNHINTFNKLCIGCFKIFKLRINSNYLNPNYNDFKHLKRNIINSTISIFKKFIKTFNNLILLDRFEIQNFRNLLVMPMREYVNSFYQKNYSSSLINDIFSSVILHSIKEFKKYGNKFQSIIICLEQFIQ